MNEDQTAGIEAAAARLMELGEEVEAPGEATVGGTRLEQGRAALHAWVDTVRGVVVNPALGRVTLIHENGRESTISSPDLPFAMSAPVSGTPNA